MQILAFVAYKLLYSKFACTAVIVLVLLVCPKAYAQVDSTYIQPFEEDFSARTYFMNKVAGFSKETLQSDEELNYLINAPMGIGVGVAWREYSLSVSQRFNFMRNRNRGETNSLAFQYNGFKRKFIYSISLQQHRGFYDGRRNRDGSYTLHPDMTLTMYGGSFQWVFNNRKFSYKAAFNQSERQLKPAGSFQLGGAIYYSRLTTDSTMIFGRQNENLQNLQFGVTGGYAYTWVLDPRWFATVSLDGGINVGNNYPDRFFSEKIEIYPSAIFRGAVGYNINSWSFGFSVHYNKVYLLFDDDNMFSMDEFNMQLNIIKRFRWGNPFVNRKLKETQDTLKKFGL